jgi:hypothetical protein
VWQRQATFALFLREAERHQVLDQFELPGSRLKLGARHALPGIAGECERPFSCPDIVARGGFDPFKYAVQTDPLRALGVPPMASDIRPMRRVSSPLAALEHVGVAPKVLRRHLNAMRSPWCGDRPMRSVMLYASAPQTLQGASQLRRVGNSVGLASAEQ